MRYAVLVVCAVLLISFAGEASAQRGGGGGGGSGGGMAGGCAGGGMGMQGNMSSSMQMSGSVSGQLLTSPGSDYYDQLVAQQMQRAYLQQQYAIAAAQAAKKADRRERIKQSIIARKQRDDASEMARRSPGEQLARE